MEYAQLENIFNSIELEYWLLHTSAGRDILKKEREFFQKSALSIFGQNSLQLGLPNINLLHGNKIQTHHILNLDLECNLNFLPFADNSIDLIICPHALEYYNNYEHILKEIYRIITPHGKLILTSFNRCSWINLYKNSFKQLRNYNFIKLSALKSKLIEVGFQINGGKFFGYCPPFEKASKFVKYNWLNKVGDRWFPTYANSFGLILRKDCVSPTIIKPRELNSFKTLTTPIGATKIWNKN